MVRRVDHPAIIAADMLLVKDPIRAVLLTIFVCAAARAQEPLPHVLDISWRRGPDLPQAFQDSDGGIVDSTLITTCGYSDSGQTIPRGKEAKSPPGHHRKTWGLKLDDPAAKWETLP